MTKKEMTLGMYARMRKHNLEKYAEKRQAIMNQMAKLQWELIKLEDQLSENLSNTHKKFLMDSDRMDEEIIIVEEDDDDDDSCR